MLEILAHRNAPKLTRNHKSVLIHIPEELLIETVLPDALPVWDDQDEVASKAFGDGWYDSQRSPVLRVPSVVTHGPEFNLVLNAIHPQFRLIEVEEPVAVVWDLRLAR
jgi:RES domain-containing protein